MKQIAFTPFPGLRSNHLQTVLCSLLPTGQPPPSEELRITLEDGDTLSCKVSTPNHPTRTTLLVHGLGGSHNSNYMIRMARKLYEKNHRVVRINLRGTGSGRGLSKLPYNAGTSDDLFQVIKALQVPVTVIGFSLGGNIVLKLAGELGMRASHYVERFIAVCPPFDLLKTVGALQERKNFFYHHYYLKIISRQARPWIKGHVQTLYEFDDKVTAPLWGYQGADAYYESCSSKRFLPHIAHETRILLSEDDPFIPLDDTPMPSPSIEIYRTKHGGHMGFLGKKTLFWLDELLLNWVEGERCY